MESQFDEMNKSYDARIADGSLTDNSFSIYAQNLCWYCGKPYEGGKRYKDIINLSRYESKRVSYKRVSRTEYKTIEVPQCINCLHIHQDETNRIERAQKTFKFCYWGAAIVTPIVLFLFTKPWDAWDWGAFATLFLAAAFVSFAIYMLVRAIVMMIVSSSIHKRFKKQYGLRRREDIPAVKKAMEHKYFIDKFS